MNEPSTECLKLAAKSLIFQALRRVSVRPLGDRSANGGGPSGLATMGAAKPGEVLKAKSPPPARHSVESSRLLRSVSGGEGPKAAGRLRRAGQDRKGHGTPWPRLFEGSPGVVLCPFATGLTRELVGTVTDLRVSQSSASKPERRRLRQPKTIRGAFPKNRRASWPTPTVAAVA